MSGVDFQSCPSTAPASGVHPPFLVSQEDRNLEKGVGSMPAARWLKPETLQGQGTPPFCLDHWTANQTNSKYF